VSLRERGKEKRRDGILSAADRLIRRDGIDAVAMRALADAAGVSVATVYNLYGSKEAVLFALMNRALDALVLDDLSNAPLDPIALSRSMTRASITYFTKDAGLYRPLLRALRDCAVTSQTLQFVERSEVFLETAVRAAVLGGQIEPVLSPSLLTRMMLEAYARAGDLWSLGVLDDDGFLAQALYGIDLTWLAAATTRARPAIVKSLRATEKKLAQAVRRQRAMFVTVTA
jgi:AcrR family transcriptional regulator